MKLLDLFCGGGLAAAGYWQSGCFTEIVGVDIEDMSTVYPFDFIRGNALRLDYDFLAQFDFIHASPPCQAYSKQTPKHARPRHAKLIRDTHAMLYATGLPYAIENVEGSGAELRPNLLLSGMDVGLPMHRPRYFHLYLPEKMTSLQSSQISRCGFAQKNEINGCCLSHEVSTGCLSKISGDRKINVITGDHSQVSIEGNINLSSAAQSNLSYVEKINPHDNNHYITREQLIAAFGLKSLPVAHIRRLTIPHIQQGIPPAMTKFIARSVFNKAMIG